MQTVRRRGIGCLGRGGGREGLGGRAGMGSGGWGGEGLEGTVS